jgi:hypothetical protein
VLGDVAENGNQEVGENNAVSNCVIRILPPNIIAVLNEGHEMGEMYNSLVNEKFVLKFTRELWGKEIAWKTKQ